MTHLRRVPSVYTSRWSANIVSTGNGIDTAVLRSTHSHAQNKYNTSCDNCRKSRVKCSGGHPCKRCATSPSPSPCAYSISRRRGKHRADVNALPGSNGTYENSSQSQTPPNSLEFDLVTPKDWMNIEGNPWSDMNGHVQSQALDAILTAPDTEDLFNGPQSPSLTDFLNSLEATALPPPSTPKQTTICSSTCYLPVHHATSAFLTLESEPHPDLGQILQLIQESVGHGHAYLKCTSCPEKGCAQYMNIALLLQRQVSLLSDVTKSPERYLDPERTSIVMGLYKPDDEDATLLKQFMLLRAAHRVTTLVNRFQDGAQDFEDRHQAGKLELGDTGKLNMKWLLGTATNLGQRLEFVKSFLERAVVGAPKV